MTSTFLIGYPNIPESANYIESSATYADLTPHVNLRAGPRYQIAQLSSTTTNRLLLDYDLGSLTKAANYAILARADILQSNYVTKFVLRGSTKSAFCPDDITGLKLWLDGTKGVTANASAQVATWADQSGNSNDATQSTAGNKPYQTRADNKGNGLLYSQAIATGGWSTGSSSRTNNYATNYDGTATAARLLASAGSAVHQISQGGPTVTPPSKNFTLSIYLKYSTRQYVWFGDQNDASWRGCNIDVQNGTIQNTTNITSSSITSIGSGWYLVSIVFTRTNAGWPTVAVNLSFSGVTTGSGASFVAAGTEDVLIGNVSMVESTWDTTMVTTTDYPAFPGVNGNRALMFDGSDDYLTCDSAASLLSGSDIPFTLFVVFKPHNGAVNSYFWSVGNSGSAAKYHSYCITSTDNFRAERSDDTATAVSSTASSTAAPTVRYYSAVFPGTTLSVYDNASIIINGVSFNVGTTTTNRMTIGALGRSTYGSYSNGAICEVLLYNSALGTTDRQTVEAYLASKWVTAPLVNEQTLATATLYGPRSDDYISTFTTSSAFRHWWAEFDCSATTKYPFSKLYFGSWLDMGEPDSVTCTKDPASQIEFISGAGAKYVSRNEEPKYQIKATWVGVSDDNLTSFITNVADNSYAKQGVFLYTSSGNDRLDGKRLIHCRLIDFDSERIEADWNIVNVTFEELLG